MTNKSDQKSTIKNVFHYTITSVIGNVFSIMKTLLLPFIFSPSQLGIWNVTSVIVNYFSNGHLGLLHSMNKEVPPLLINKHFKIVKNIQNSIFLAVFSLGIFCLLGLIISSFFVDLQLSNPLRVLSFIALFQLLFYFYFSLLRAESKFLEVSIGILIFSILSSILVILIPILIKKEITYSLFGLLIAYIITIYYWNKKNAFLSNLDYKIDKAVIRKSLSIGFPLILVGLLDSFFISIDRWLIYKHFTKYELGLYVFGLMVGSLISMIPSNISSVLYNRLLEINANKEDSKYLVSFFQFSQFVLSNIVIAIIIVVIYTSPLVIEILLPNYKSSLPIVNIFSFGSFFISTSFLTSSFLTVVNKQGLILRCQIISIIFSLIALSTSIFFNFDLYSISIVTILSYLFYSFLYLISTIATYQKGFLNIAAKIFKYYLPLVITLLIFIFLQKYFNNNIINNNFKFILFEILLTFFILTPIIYFLNKNEFLKLFNFIKFFISKNNNNVKTKT
jgi:O-antigen/teichoic acid export membrane protein